MATEKPRFTITMDENLLDQIDDYKFTNRIKSQSKAIVELVQRGLNELEKDRNNTANAIKHASEVELSTTEAINNIDLFASVLERAGLIPKGGDISDSDLEFLKAMFIAIKAHFKNGNKGLD